MKRAGAIPTILLAVCMLQACGHSTIFSGSSDADSLGTDTTATLNLAVDKDDSDFAVNAVNSNNYEIELGRLAVKNGKSKMVKNYGLMMIKDRGKANTRLMLLSKAKNLNLPATPGAAGQKIIAELSKKTGGDFDKAYISNMVSSHTEDIKLFTDATKAVQDPDLKKYAIKILPVIQKHLDAINGIHDSMSSN